MSHIVESCPVNKLDGGILRLHSAEEIVQHTSRVTHTTRKTAHIPRAQANRRLLDRIHRTRHGQRRVPEFPMQQTL